MKKMASSSNPTPLGRKAFMKLTIKKKILKREAKSMLTSAGNREGCPHPARCTKKLS